MRSTHGIDVERMRSFADAVFAIAITLLALEMKVPEGLPSAELGHVLKDALPSVAGYVLSFAVVGALWLSHHRLFGMVRVLDSTLLHLDLVLLAIVAALPFPTRIISAYHGSALATSLYAAVISFAALLVTVMFVHLGRHPDLGRPDAPGDLRTRSMMLSGTVALVFATSIPMTLLSPGASEYWWILVVPLRLVLMRRFHGTAERTPDVVRGEEAGRGTGDRPPTPAGTG